MAKRQAALRCVVLSLSKDLLFLEAEKILRLADSLRTTDSMQTSLLVLSAPVSFELSLLASPATHPQSWLAL